MLRQNRGDMIRLEADPTLKHRHKKLIAAAVFAVERGVDEQFMDYERHAKSHPKYKEKVAKAFIMEIYRRDVVGHQGVRSAYTTPPQLR